MIDEIERVAIRSKPHSADGTGQVQVNRNSQRKYSNSKRRKTNALENSLKLIALHFVEKQQCRLFFGHKKGSFTGAQQERAGLLKAADQGLLFLDEIGELGLDEQAMLLRAIEEKSFFPLGSDKEIESDFQLICGTNRNLIQASQDGEFRADLLARINLWTYTLPGLKDRPEDIEPNIQYELENYSQESGQAIRFNKEAYVDFSGTSRRIHPQHGMVNSAT